MKKLSKNDKISRILKGSVMTIMLATAIIGAVGMGSNANAENNGVVATEIEGKVDNGDSFKIEGDNIEIDQYGIKGGIKIENGNKNSNVNVWKLKKLEAPTRKDNYMKKGGDEKIVGESFYSDGENGFLNSGINDKQGEVYLKPSGGPVVISSNIAINRDFINNESIDRPQSIDQNEIIKVEKSEAEGFRTMENNSGGVRFIK
ncbi:hypothetical protein [Peptostreptococcus porci]|uniref:hypothetical protein n=1 Tax=Peptostreptococcus porci TaxID=2652282 RepID=UPI002A759829|nr:hypothetical protein [Peptostreptococcus porci]MDY2794241.1 hypothetical protein [Peptostreptococcus porci]MDY4127991.1 hypothetical protein [Peptostreptococcus porci]